MIDELVNQTILALRYIQCFLRRFVRFYKIFNYQLKLFCYDDSVVKGIKQSGKYTSRARVIWNTCTILTKETVLFEIAKEGLKNFVYYCLKHTNKLYLRTIDTLINTQIDLEQKENNLMCLIGS